jgi:hypothetical protein
MLRERSNNSMGDLISHGLIELVDGDDILGNLNGDEMCVYCRSKPKLHIFCQ